MDNLETPEKYKPVPKAHLFLHKLRKINTIDREIRQKWLKLQRKKIQQQQQTIQHILEIQKMKKNSELEEQIQIKVPIQQNRIIRMRSDIMREETLLRKKLYDDIYYKKSKRDHSPTLVSVFKKENSPKHQNRNRAQTEAQESDSPHLLKRRNKSIEKQLTIIKNRYEDDIRTISSKKNLQEREMWDKQEKMLKKIEGKKFYYQLTSTWQPST